MFYCSPKKRGGQDHGEAVSEGRVRNGGVDHQHEFAGGAEAVPIVHLMAYDTTKGGIEAAGPPRHGRGPCAVEDSRQNTVVPGNITVDNALGRRDRTRGRGSHVLPFG
jgi:hypothetical protein